MQSALGSTPGAGCAWGLYCMSEAESEQIEVEEIWVNTNEAAEITGYNRFSLSKIASMMAQEPEDQRAVKVRKRSNGWELWLPDLMVYVKRPRRGPPIKSRKQESS
jgi:hypothetical protein